MNEFISTTDLAAKWKISARRIALLCEQGRVEGSQKVGGSWIIPLCATKPKDGRKGRKVK
jgi:hypothetical protein